MYKNPLSLRDPFILRIYWVDLLSNIHGLFGNFESNTLSSNVTAFSVLIEAERWLYYRTDHPHGNGTALYAIFSQQ